MNTVPLKLRVYRMGKLVYVEPVNLPGSPSIGIGTTLLEAFGSFFITYQKALGVEEIEIDPSAQADEDKRRKDALSEC
jgi:hypothetical protein